MASPGFRSSPRSAMTPGTPSKVTTPRPSTPASASHAASLPSTPPMSRWLHPRMNEINRRKNASTFGERNIQTIVWSGAFLVLSVLASPAVDRLEEMLPVIFKTFVQFLFEESADAAPSLAEPGQATPDGRTMYGISVLGWVLVVVRLYLIGLIAHALRPLFFAPDDFSDIPLTPTQRSLLNLPPLPTSKASTPASTPGSGILTPPRLPRSPATSTRSRSLSASIEPSTTRAVGGSSPVTFSTPPRFSPSASQRSASGSPLGMSIRDRSPLADSIGLGRSNSVGAGYSPSLRGRGKRWSLGGAGSSGGLGESSMSSMSVGPGSPTSLPRAGAPNVGGVGLNNKWLYERFRSSGMAERRPYS